MENAVRIFHTKVFAPLRNQTLHSIKDINRAIRELLEEHNAMSLRGREVEQQEIRPLPALLLTLRFIVFFLIGVAKESLRKTFEFFSGNLKVLPIYKYK